MSDLAVHPFHYGADLELSMAAAKAVIFRFNGRNAPMAAFQTLLGISTPTSVANPAPESAVEAFGINVSLLEHISPIEWENVVLYGEYVLNRELIRRS